MHRVKAVDQRDHLVCAALCELLRIVLKLNEIVKVARAFMLSGEMTRDCDEALG